mgnify:CR=1 FL=1
MLQNDGKFVKVLNRIADLVGLNLLAILFWAIHNSRLWMHLSHTGEKRRISDKGFLEVV